MSRYLERAENLARLVEVNRYDALDHEGPAETSDPQWNALLSATCSEEAYAKASAASDDPIEVSWFITFSPHLTDTIRGCIAHARENARMVRDQISEDMWLELNSFHLFMRSSEAEELWHHQPDALYRRTIKFCLLFSGLINSTLRRDEGWRFIQTGKFLERADKTTRILDMVAYDEAPPRARLISTLRSCSALSAFRESFRGDISLEQVTDFLLFAEDFPRSVRFCLRSLDADLHAISGVHSGAFSNEAERLTGSTLAQLNFSSVGEVRSRGLRAYVDDLQQRFNDIGQQVFETYILLPSEIERLPLVTEGSTPWQQMMQQQQ
jgi:uncharacterized alpha-E superfamily protein